MSVDYRVLIGDCLDTLKTLPEQSVHTCVTSPPYFGLRDYGVEGQLGAEPTPDEFVEALVRVFREVRRVLRDDGTVWLNLGDSYANSVGGVGNNPSSKSTLTTNGGKGPKAGDKYARGNEGKAVKINPGVPSKNLLGIPWRVAFALQQDGWYLRQDIIWHKPNPMPESVRDRCTKSHEYVFLLSKSPKYYYDAEAVKEPEVCGRQRGPAEHPDKKSTNGNGGLGRRKSTGMRNRRTVWTVTTRPYKGAHFATFPPDLIQPCILAGCPEGGTVLDPFGGSGTTAGVALAHGRNAVLCELNPEYAELVPERIDWITDYYKVPRVEHPRHERGAEIDDFDLDLDLDDFDLDMDLAV